MSRLSEPVRIALGLAGITVCVMLLVWVSDHSPGSLERRLLPLSALAVSLGALGYSLHQWRMLRTLNPEKVIPSRVKMALDTMAEGLVILDAQGNIMMANPAFAKTVGGASDDLIGRNVEELPWKPHAQQPAGEPLPWQATLEKGQPRLGGLVHFCRGHDTQVTFLVNATPIHDQAGESGGALVSFYDITAIEQSKNELERNRVELSQMLDNLRRSSDEIRRQNRELEQLATRDPLTGCHNRRAFFERFNILWKSAQRHNHQLSCIMVDIDHFKRVNDTFRHVVGDQVLQRVGQILNKAARDSDIVCRYGGEEFAILLPYTGLSKAAETAERFRQFIENARFPQLSITASLGVSAMSLGAKTPQELLDQADRCLFVAKRNGRNQVVRCDKVQSDLTMQDIPNSRSVPAEDDGQTGIPYQAVTALISALAYRDVATAEHSRRVADLCVAAGEGLMSLTSCYVLENAALLHDIGKIGVPDSILLKPGTLSDEEWQIMRRQERIGSEIIRASFHSRELVAIVANHKAWFGGTPHDPHLPKGNDIPLGARILSIVNAYDAMISPQVYRAPRSQEEAFAELRRCAGTQFDPALVEHFIAVAKVRRMASPPDVAHISQETALQFGLQIERLMSALDTQDIIGLQTLADRLHAMAEKHQIREIAQKASELAVHTHGQSQATEILHTANELIELCRSTQSSYVRIVNDV
jgi:diguanylate cyclase (GGDEF)-like protein/PAS domain S-box-containing protein